MSPAGDINAWSVAQSLFDAKSDIAGIIQNIRAKRDEQSRLLADAVRYEIVLNEVCLSWHRRWMDGASVDRINQEAFELLCRSIPRWDTGFEIVPLVPLGGVAGESARQFHSPTDLTRRAAELQNTIGVLADRAHQGGSIADYDRESIPVYREIVCELCQLWYGIYAGMEEIARSGVETRGNIRIPNWAIADSFRLVDVDWRMDVRTQGRDDGIERG
ncbi:MAG: hypothetical protein IT443_13445 [Phycisphaeraceae bacterium]|nr:hypothetical protein [Phycisphaeraceae bacterium]